MIKSLTAKGVEKKRWKQLRSDERKVDPLFINRLLLRSKAFILLDLITSRNLPAVIHRSTDNAFHIFEI